MTLARRCAIVAVVVAALFIVLAACWRPTPTPPESPISPVPTPVAVAYSSSLADTSVITDVMRLFWNDPAIEGGTAFVHPTIENDVVVWVCEGALCPDDYPFTPATQTVSVTFRLWVDLEARTVEGAILDATSFRTSLTAPSEPGENQFDGDLPLDWVPDTGHALEFEAWERGRWSAPGFPDIPVVPVRDGELSPLDSRGFTSLGRYVGRGWRYFLPLVMKR